MKIIGLTGGIGSGKSTVATILTHLGIPVYSADDRAKYWVENHDALKKNILNLLGPQAYLPTGEYNRAWVAQQVFSSNSLLNQINQCIHPIVQADFQTWLTQQTSPIVAKEAALIYSKEGYDALWVITAPLETRIQRIQRRDPHRTLAQIQAILSKQPKEEEFLKLATHQIENNTTSLIVPQILAALAT